jgi:hypothetical protein
MAAGTVNQYTLLMDVMFRGQHGPVARLAQSDLFNALSDAGFSWASASPVGKWNRRGKSV